MIKTGGIGWLDLTVPNADNVRDFYASVCDWSPVEVSMGDYADYAMAQADGTSVAGICHARGGNADLPNVWLPYFVVEDLEAAEGLLAPVELVGQHPPQRPPEHPRRRPEVERPVRRLHVAPQPQELQVLLLVPVEVPCKRSERLVQRCYDSMPSDH